MHWPAQGSRGYSLIFIYFNRYISIIFNVNSIKQCSNHFLNLKIGYGREKREWYELNWRRWDFGVFISLLYIF